jgi:HD-GYP domain-containing protein (c-di-GMP phosphodiesterase class II)
MGDLDLVSPRFDFRTMDYGEPASPGQGEPPVVLGDIQGLPEKPQSPDTIYFLIIGSVYILFLQFQKEYLSISTINYMQADQKRLEEIIRLDSELNRIQDLDILLERILLEARRAVDADAGSIYIKNEDRLVIKYSQNDTQQKKLPPGQKLIYSIFSIEINEKTISGYVAAKGEPLNIEDMYNIPKKAPYNFDPSFDRISKYKTISTLTIPLQTNIGDIVGVLQLINKMDKEEKVIPFTDVDELFAMHFASSATLALQRAQMTRAILLRMISMAQLRDPKETGSHVNRVAGYAVEIYERWAQKHDVPEAEFEKTRDILRMAAMLHDVGKVAISDLILKKPGRFTDDEYEIMKSHTYLGARLFLDKQSEFDGIASQVALTHHENWDGSGYPGQVDIENSEIDPTADTVKEAEGRKSSEIPLMGRIVALADVYDALSCRRVYKEAWNEEDVYEEIKKCAGSKFDPALVDIFFEILPNLKQITERYPDTHEGPH